VYVLARHRIAPRFATGSAWLGVFVIGYLLAGLDGVGAVLAFSFAVQVAPSIWTAYRQSNLHGIIPADVVAHPYRRRALVRLRMDRG